MILPPSSILKTSFANSMNLFKSAFDDIRTGNFSMDNISNDMYDDYESQTSASFSMPTGDDAIDMLYILSCE